MFSKALLITLFLLAGCVTGDGNNLRVEVGDKVAVDYTGRTLGDNLVFDTTNESIAMDPGVDKVPWFVLKKAYEPLVFTVGSGQLLSAFEKGFVGAEIGSKKTLVLPPEEAFGEWNESLVMPVPKVAVVPLISDVPRSVFETGAGKEPVINDTVQLKYWPAMVVGVTEDTVTLQSLPENGSIVVTDYAPAEITLNSTHAILELIPRPGIAYTPMGPARAVAEDQTSILFDYNHPLAGKTLVFETVVRNITKLQKN